MAKDVDHAFRKKSSSWSDLPLWWRKIAAKCMQQVVNRADIAYPPWRKI